MELTWFSERAEYRQRFRLTGATDSITGNVYFMVCDDRQCLPPTQKNFTVAVPASVQQSSQESGSIGSAGTRWGVLFGKGFLGGLLALLTPCVFPMIPLTVSFFTKQGGSRMAAARDAGIYGLSIILIYVSLGLLVTALFGADALNAMASNGIFNMAFFLLLLVFAISFFGAFEITLPHQLVNKVQSQTSKGGFIGIFFMAFTLALVSFSCTGPIIGALLVDAASDGSTLAPFLGMAGFASALALPFSLFALFPSWLKSLPKSGGWLNSVKVVLGFLELGFSLKFLSNVDLAYHWNWLDREVFLSLWIIISALLGLYLLGKLRLPHDPPVERLPVPRLLLAIVALSFSVYLVPGLWGAPLKAVSGFLPPQGSQDFDLSRLEYMVGNQSGGGTSQLAGDAAQEARKHADKFECPHNLNCFFDYQEGMAYARKHDMPVFLDFTGHTCVNCRKMEASVWSHPQVHNYLKNKYVLISLYVDDKTKLPKEERYTSDFSGKRVTTLGGKWSDIQASRFGANSQPYYVLLNHQGNKLAPARGYNQDVQAYLDFLEKGLQQFKASQANTADVGEDTETSSFRF
jgi:thiol:disulfide interchange protein DsbD